MAGAPPSAPVASGDRAGGGSSAEGSVRDLSKLDLRLKPKTDDPPGVVLPPVPKPPPARRTIVEGLDLRPTNDGGYVYADSAFGAKIAADGQVVIWNKLPGVEISPGEVLPGDGVQPWIIKPPMVGFQIDITDVVMRLAGDDPYQHRKLRFLEKTLPLRAQMAEEACQERLTRAIIDLKGDLERLWADASVPVEVRRRQLFQMWDDCADDPRDGNLVGYGDQARATVIAFIKAKLPATSLYAYTPAELVALNRRRRSALRFDPYGDLSGP